MARGNRLGGTGVPSARAECRPSPSGKLDGTPFTTTTLKELFGLYGTSKAADQILEGTFDITSLGMSESRLDVSPSIETSREWE